MIKFHPALSTALTFNAIVLLGGAFLAIAITGVAHVGQNYKDTTVSSNASKIFRKERKRIIWLIYLVRTVFGIKSVACEGVLVTLDDLEVVDRLRHYPEVAFLVANAAIALMRRLDFR